MQEIQALKKLNEYQRAAVLDESNACLVNANVGSGKTTVLISKILYLQQQKHVPLEKMVVLTFTNKAADEIKERLLLQDKTIDPTQMPCFGTFHSVALYLLKESLPLENVGYQKDFLVMEPEEELEMAIQLILEKSLKIKYKNRLKKRLEQAMAIHEEEKKVSRYQDDIFLLVDALKEEKKRQNKMSFQDLINMTCILLEQEPIRPEWIIIDEVQDSDEKQIEMIQHLKGEKTHLFAVGDPNQVIYSWRGSAFQVFHLLKRLYQATEYTLPINYRSSSSILEAAKYFLQSGNPLEGIREPGDLIVLKNHYDSFQEADYLAGKIRQLHEAGIAYKEIAVFYRLQSQSKVLEDVWSREGIPYEVSYKKTMKDIPVLAWLLKLLRFSVHTEDVTSGIAVLSQKDYGFHLTEQEALRLIRNDSDPKHQIAISSAEESMHQQSKKSIQSKELLKKAIQFQEWTHFLDQEKRVYRLSEEIWNYFDLAQYLRPTSASYTEDKDAVMEFLKILEEYQYENGRSCLESMREFLNLSSLYGVNILKKDMNGDEDSVKLMTLHASKGLEFSHVFIIGINYGLIPLQTRGFEEEEEERRLFFVGITRAKNKLELSFYTNLDGQRVMSGPSRYLSMIPARLIQQENRKTPEYTQTRLQEIKKEILRSRTEMNALFPDVSKPAKEKDLDRSEKIDENRERRLVRHTKYGIGNVIKEDDTMITVQFEDYGEKDFVKAFSELITVE